MQPHIQQTIEDIRAKREELATLETRLRAFALAGPGQPELAEPPPPSAVDRLEPLAVARRAPVAKGKKKSGPRSGATERNEAAGRALPEPFGFQEFARAAEVNDKAGSSTINRWKQRGWLRRVGRNQYERTAKFPAGAPAKENRPAAAGESNPPTLRARLERALQDRDQAQANGNETLARIHQERVDELQAQLGE